MASSIVRSITSASFARFENQAVIPTTAQLEGPLAEAAAGESVDQLVAVDTSGAAPVLVGAEATGAASGEVENGEWCTSVRRSTRPGGCVVGGQDVVGRLGFGGHDRI